MAAVSGTGKTIAQRLRAIAPTDDDGCWMWSNYIDRDGYGYMMWQGRYRPAHAVSYETFSGPIPDGMELDHLCRNRSCINPAHLEPVTHAENVRRANAANPRARKEFCPQGHPYAGENLRLTLCGARMCVTCRRKQDREGQKRRRERAR